MADCAFCCSHSFWGKWRGQSPERILAEISHLYSQYGLRRFWFIDASFEDGGGRNRLNEICQRIEESKLSISYYANFRTTVWKLLDNQLLSRLRKTGLSGVFLGVEAGNIEDYSLYQKPGTLTDCIKSINTFQSMDISVAIGFINFNPFSTMPRLQQNVAFLEQQGFACDISKLLSRYIPNRGSKLYLRTEKASLMGVAGGQEYTLFEDKDVAKLYKGIQEGIGKILRFDQICAELYYYCAEVRYCLSYLRQYTRNNASLCKRMNEISLGIDTILKKLNAYNANGFRKVFAASQLNSSGKLIASVVDWIGNGFLEECLRDLRKYGFILTTEICKTSEEHTKLLPLRPQYYLDA